MVSWLLKKYFLLILILWKLINDKIGKTYLMQKTREFRWVSSIFIKFKTFCKIEYVAWNLLITTFCWKHFNLVFNLKRKSIIKNTTTIFRLVSAHLDWDGFSTPLRTGSKISRECRFLHVYNFKFYCGLLFSILAHCKC